MRYFGLFRQPLLDQSASDKRAEKMAELELIDDLCERFEEQQQSGEAPKIEEFLDHVDKAKRPSALQALLEIELEYAAGRSGKPRREDYESRFPEYVDVIRAAFREASRRWPEVFIETGKFGTQTAENWPASPSSAPDGQAMSETGDWPSSEFKDTVHQPGVLPTDDNTSSVKTIGRYRVEKVLGQGAFGTVYLASDDDLDRQVAIKLPRIDRKSPDKAEAFREEGRALARLDHPHILPVYDVGLTEDGYLYVVSKYVADSQTLSDYCRERELTFEQITDVLAKVAWGLSSAHENGLVHRDIKPDNILIGDDQSPYVVDFGLALHEDEQSDRPDEFAGTPAYMSPEQFRRKSQFLDGRSDIWSVGVVLYELLTGRHPFTGSTLADLRDEVLERDPKPPRQINSTVPEKLEQVCLRCLEKDITRRYATAADLENDLRSVFRKKRIPIPMIVGAVAAAAILIVSITFWIAGKQPPPSQPANPETGLSPERQARIDRALASLQKKLNDKDKKSLVTQVQDLNLTKTKHVAEIEWPKEMQAIRDKFTAAQAAGDTEAERSALFKASQNFVSMGRFDSAEAACLRMEEITKGNPTGHAFALLELGLAQAKNRRLASAIESYEKGVGLFEQFYKLAPTQPIMAKYLGTSYMRLANAYKDGGSYEDAATYYEQAKGLYERANLKSQLASLLGNYGNLQSQLGKLDESVALHEQAMALERELKDEQGQAVSLANLGNAYHRADRVEEALKYYQDAYQFLSDKSSYELKTILLLKLTMALLDQGKLDEAKKTLEELKKAASEEDAFIQGSIRTLESAIEDDDDSDLG